MLPHWCEGGCFDRAAAMWKSNVPFKTLEVTIFRSFCEKSHSALSKIRPSIRDQGFHDVITDLPLQRIINSAILGWVGIDMVKTWRVSWVCEKRGAPSRRAEIQKKQRAGG